MKIILFSAIALVSSNFAWALPCYDLSKGEPKSLNGKLTYVIYAGPPNFESVQKGDAPESTYVLELKNPICLSGDDYFANPKLRFNKVHLVSTKETSHQLKSSINQNVTVSLKDQFAAHTAHHHQPLVAWVTSVRLEKKRPQTSQVLDYTEEYGTAATTIRAFYEALENGQGEIASSYIAPEKRSIPAFNGPSMTRFYSSLTKPIQLVEIAKNGYQSYTVKYRYATNSKVCNGIANITTTVRDGKNFIFSIKPLNGC